MAECPFCLELVHDGAIFCKHCGEKLDTDEAESLTKTRPDVLSGSIESKMDGLATFFLVLGIIGLICCTAISCSYWDKYSDKWEDEVGIIWLVSGIVSVIHGLAISIILRAGAEVIRLLREIRKK